MVDLYGETVLSTTLSGEHFRKRHDQLKIFQMCQWAGLEAEVEVFNLFAGEIPQEGLSRMERGRNLRITIPVEDNPTPSLNVLAAREQGTFLTGRAKRQFAQWIREVWN